MSTTQTHKEALTLARQLLWRYRHETPVGNQPYMICQEVDEAFERIDEALSQPSDSVEQEPKCNPHPKAPHGFNRNASHANDRYTCECESWDAYDAGYQAGVMAGIEASMGQEPEQEPDEVDIRSRLYQRIDDLEAVLRDIAEYTGEGPATTDYRGIVKLVSDSARNALEESIDDGMCRVCDGSQCTAKAGCVAISNPPPQRKPLTDEEIIQIASTPDGSQATTKGYVIPFARAIEAAHGIKEST